MHAALDAFIHHRPALEQSGTHLIGAAQRKLIGAHHFRDALLRYVALLEQPRGVGEGIGNVQRFGRFADPLRLGFIDHEASAHREEDLAQDDRARIVVRGEAHTVAVERQRLVDAEVQMVLLAERNLAPPVEHERALLADAPHFGLDLVRVDPIGGFAGQSEQDRAIGAMAAAGECERAVKIDDDLSRRIELGVGSKLVGETLRRTHRPYGVRARRPQPYLEKVERAYEHSCGSRCRIRLPNAAAGW